MTNFDEIVALYELSMAREYLAAERIREQREICQQILADMLYRGVELDSETERFVLRCNRTTSPLDSSAVLLLTLIRDTARIA